MPYLQPNGKWRGTRMINDQRRARIFQTKKEALAWELQQSAETWMQEEYETTLLISWLDFATAYLQMAKERYSEKTWAEKRRAFKLSLLIISLETIAQEVSGRQALAVLRRVASETSGNAANKTRKNLAAAWAWGRRYYGFPQENPWRGVEKFPADQQPRYVPPEEDFWRVFEVADRRDKAFLLFLLHTGARCGEAFRLTWNDVDMHGKRVRLGTRKSADGGMRYAWRPLTSQLHEALADLKLRQPGSGNVFRPKRRGSTYTARQHMMPLLCARAGVKPFGFHAIRHLAATIQAYAGLDLPTVQGMLRHQSPTTTARYIKSLGIQQEKIEAAFTKKEGAKVVPFAPLKKAICT